MVEWVVEKYSVSAFPSLLSAHVQEHAQKLGTLSATVSFVRNCVRATGFLHKKSWWIMSYFVVVVVVAAAVLLLQCTAVTCITQVTSHRSHPTATHFKSRKD